MLKMFLVLHFLKGFTEPEGCQKVSRNRKFRRKLRGSSSKLQATLGTRDLDTELRVREVCDCRPTLLT